MSGAVSVLSVECPACCALPGSPCLSDHAYGSGVWSGCDARRYAAGVVGAPSAWWVVDPGHAWLCVPLATVSGVSVSSFSFVDRERGLVYLEEDCDAGNWARFLGVKLAAFPVRRFRGSAPCRSLPRVHDGDGFVVFSAVAHGGRRPVVRCGECGRGFDLSNAEQAAEWHYGHDCEG